MVGKRRINLPPEELREMFQRMSADQIAAHYGCGHGTVWLRLQESGIVYEGPKQKNGKRKMPPRTLSHKLAMSRAKKGRWSGERNPHWKGGVHQENLKARATGEYKQWKQAAIELAGFRCQDCGRPDKDECSCCGTRVHLHVHHVKSFALFPNLRFDPANSEVLCPKCHDIRHASKPGELLETPNVKTRAISSQASEDKGSEEGSTTRP